MASNRKPTIQEINLIRHLAQKAGLELGVDWDQSLMVTPLNDDGMGSLRLEPHELVQPNRKMDRRVSEYIFKDADGVDVIASLNLDTNSELFELDLWKTDFSRLIALPQQIPT